MRSPGGNEELASIEDLGGCAQQVKAGPRSVKLCGPNLFLRKLRMHKSENRGNQYPKP